MQIKRYELATLKEAHTVIKRDLGADAIILSTKDIMRRGQKLLEVVAARDFTDGTVSASRLTNITADSLSCPTQEKSELLFQEIANIKSQLYALFELAAGNHYLAGSWGGEYGIADVLNAREDQEKKSLWMGIYSNLLQSGISHRQAAQICAIFSKTKTESKSRDLRDLKPQLEEIVEDDLKKFCGITINKRIKVFIGPTGAGKTTTLAKLAAHYAWDKKLKVGLITTDMYRIAAAEQLRIYANILDLPLEIARKQNDLAGSLNRFTNRDVILVDTPGRNCRDESCISSLKALLSPLGEAEVNLVLSATCSNENLLDTAARYDIMSYNNVIFTKLDECSRFGFLYDFLQKTRKAVSYLTNGQNVPQDIMVATASRLTRLILDARLN